MNNARWTLMVLTLACGTSAARADAPLIYCSGSVCGGPGPTAYAYPVDAASYPMMEFCVGTMDLDAANYTNVLAPAGWQFAVEPIGMSHACGLAAPHGEVSEGPCYSPTAGRVRWWTDDPELAVEDFVFGYDHPWCPEDTGWRLICRRPGPPPEYYTFMLSWDSPVGTGFGPVHGPWALGDECWVDDDCWYNQYCEFPLGQCAGPGTCAFCPSNCPEYWDPVCGCDGVTYANACFAAEASMSIDYEGECDWTCMYNEDCDPEDFCEYPVGVCEGPGTCQPRPEIIPPLWDPICGCDGVTYANVWSAAFHGVSVAYWGECLAGDFDGDGDVDLEDYAAFQNSFTGP